MRTPETLTATQRAARLKQDGSNPAETSDAAPVEASPVSKNQERYTAQARPLLDIGIARNATADLDPHADVDMSFSLLSIHDIDPYANNPRTQRNPRYDEIKESIRADGITNVLTVTRRPGAPTYSPYGGGNTRLQIAKELFEEGDRRFVQLRVVIKKWPGDAGVISAHLVENEVRGDISFWEKAQGVAAFKREFESEKDQTLTANELNRELRQRGLNYGVRTLQNFLFAIENLAPIGPWLASNEVNTVIRPSVNSLLDLGLKFDRQDLMRSEIHGVLEKRAGDLVALTERNEGLDDAERQPTVIDVPSLLEDLQVAAAAVLEVEPVKVPLMTSALSQNPRADVQALKQITARTSTPSGKTGAGNGHSDANAQRPLSGMLAGVPRSSVGTGSAGADSPFPSTEQCSSGRDATSDHSGAEAPASAEASPDKLLHDVQDCMAALNQVVPLHDVLRSSEDFPFGFMVDFPKAMDMVDGHPITTPVLDYRIVLWKLLVTFSGQLNAAVSELIPSDQPGVRWGQFLAQGEETFARACYEVARAAYAKGEIFLSSMELSMVFAEPSLGSTLVRLLQVLQTIRTRFPLRIPAELRSLFPAG